MLRLIALVCGLAAGGYSMSAAFRSGFGMATGPDAYVIGIAFLGLVGCSWVTGPAAAKAWQDRSRIRGLGLGVLWAFTTLVVLANSMGYIATHRGEAVGSKQVQIERYEQAKADLQRLNAEIREADANGRVKTARDLRQKIQEAEAKLEAGRPGTSDAQAETLSWITGVASTKVALAMPIWVTVALDLASMGCFFIALGASRPKPPQREPERKAKIERPRKPIVDRSKWTDKQIVDFREKRAQRALTG